MVAFAFTDAHMLNDDDTTADSTGDDTPGTPGNRPGDGTL